MVSDQEFEAFCRHGGQFLYCDSCGKRRRFSDGYCDECGKRTMDAIKHPKNVGIILKDGA